MTLKWFQTRASPIAVDLGTDNIKLLQIDARGGQPHIMVANRVDVPDHVHNDSPERDAWLVENLRRAVVEGGFRGRAVVTSFPATRMVLRHVRVPRVSEAEIPRVVMQELQGKLPFDVTTAVIRHVVVSDIYQGQDAKQEVIAMVTSRESVERHLGIFDRAKLELAGIHVEQAALVEAFSYMFASGSGQQANMFIDIGASSTHVVMAHGRKMVFTRYIPLGGEVMNRRVGQAMKWPPDKTRLMRMRMEQQIFRQRRKAASQAGATLAEYDPEGWESEDYVPMDVALEATIQESLLEPTEQLAKELEACVRYYESIFPDRPLERVIFVGGESRYLSTCAKLAKPMAIPAVLGDPLSRLLRDDRTRANINLKHPQPGWAVTVGLGLGVEGVTGV